MPAEGRFRGAVRELNIEDRRLGVKEDISIFVGVVAQLHRSAFERGGEDDCAAWRIDPLGQEMAERRVVVAAEFDVERRKATQLARASQRNANVMHIAARAVGQLDGQ